MQGVTRDNLRVTQSRCFQAEAVKACPSGISVFFNEIMAPRTGLEPVTS